MNNEAYATFVNIDEIEIRVDCIRNKICTRKCGEGICRDIEYWEY